MYRGSIKIAMTYDNPEFRGEPVIKMLDIEVNGYRNSDVLNSIRYGKKLSEAFENLDIEPVDYTSPIASVMSEPESQDEVNSGSGEWLNDNEYAVKRRAETPIPGDDDDEKKGKYKGYKALWNRMFRGLLSAMSRGRF